MGRYLSAGMSGSRITVSDLASLDGPVVRVFTSFGLEWGACLYVPIDGLHGKAYALPPSFDFRTDAFDAVADLALKQGLYEILKGNSYLSTDPTPPPENDLASFLHAFGLPESLQQSTNGLLDWMDNMAEHSNRSVHITLLPKGKENKRECHRNLGLRTRYAYASPSIFQVTEQYFVYARISLTSPRPKEAGSSLWDSRLDERLPWLSAYLLCRPVCWRCLRNPSSVSH